MQDFFSFDVLNTWPKRPLLLKVYLDNNLVSTHKVQQQETVRVNLDKEPAKHCIRLSLTRNPKLHTQLNEHQQIINDALLVVGNCKINDFDLIDRFVNETMPTVLTQINKPYVGIMAEITEIEFNLETPVIDWLYTRPDLYISNR